MKIQEIEQALDFMQLIGYSPSLGASLLSDYFTLRAEGQTPDKAAEHIFEDIPSKNQTLHDAVKGFHLRMCRVLGYPPEQVAEAVEEFYKVADAEE